MQRIIGIDLARFLAIVGMMAAHLLLPNGWVPWAVPVTDGFPAALFAVLGGFGMVFASRRLFEVGERAQAVGVLAIRGVLVGSIGVALTLLPDHLIAVVLVYYGLALLLAAPFLLAPTAVLVPTVIALLVATPPLLHAARYQATLSALPGGLDTSSFQSLLISAALTGTYPAVTWLTYLLLGVMFARMLLQGAEGGSPKRSSVLRVGIWGAALAATAQLASSTYVRVASEKLAAESGTTTADAATVLLASQRGAPAFDGWASLLVAAPHSGSATDVLRTAGAAVLLTAVLVAMTRTWRQAPPWLQPFVAAGASPLSVYVLHVVLTALTFPGWQGLASHSSALFHYSFWWQLALVIGFGAFLARRGSRGPLEIAVSTVSNVAVSNVAAADVAVSPPDDDDPQSPGDFSR